MAVVFADPFGSYIEGAVEGQQLETSYQEHALNSYVKEMEMLDDLVLAPQRQIAKEQRQYARQLDLMMQRHELARQRQQEGVLLGTDPLTGSSITPSGTGYTLDTTLVRPALGGVLSSPGAASLAPTSGTRFLGVPVP